MLGFLVFATLVLVFLMVATSVWLSGPWAGLITLVNLVLSALIATSFYNSLALAFVRQSANVEYIVLAEFLAIWLLFVLSFMVIRIAAELLTQHQMMLDTWSNLIARSGIALAVALVFCSFAFYTFHLAPLQVAGWWHDSFDRGSGGFGMGLDQGWNSYCRYASTGPLRESPWMARQMMSHVGRVAAGSSGQSVDFGLGALIEIPPEARNGQHPLPPMSDFSAAMLQFRKSIAEHYQVYYDNFMVPHDDSSKNESERRRDQANQQLEQLAKDIRQGILQRAVGNFK